eukprot:12885737-Prorocentrum_lima.AAC.1
MRRLPLPTSLTAKTFLRPTGRSWPLAHLRNLDMVMTPGPTHTCTCAFFLKEWKCWRMASVDSQPRDVGEHHTERKEQH